MPEPPDEREQDRFRPHIVETNAEPELAPEEELKPGRRLAYRAIAAIMVVVFGVFALGGVLRVVYGPDLGFLSRSRELSTDPRVRTWQKAVVRIEAYPGDPGQARLGTGFNLSPSGLVVTNRHVVEGANTVTVTFKDNGLQRVKQVVTHPSLDLAVVVLEGAGLPTVTIDQGPLPAVGAPVTVIGNPLGYPNVVARGEVTGFRTTAGREELMVLQASIHPGSSGSPVFNEAGDVVAVVFAVLEEKDPDSPIHALAIPVQYLDDILPQ